MNTCRLSGHQRARVGAFLIFFLAALTNGALLHAQVAEIRERVVGVSDGDAEMCRAWSRVI